MVRSTGGSGGKTKQQIVDSRKNNPAKAIGMLNENLFHCEFGCHTAVRLLFAAAATGVFMDIGSGLVG